ncbi:YopT-type cysteine protease domain-containing protein [uncultured Roseibium sp.]|uniref:YopT-type cysteine protease domain-containing protein n=1 Tax=uncultured Roseibium sp. TaxID=1936171 RepID=UPI002619B192|nr:YopT-type cysteine protease domain-containing protein [uncultured Roseibium sp.]
MEPEVFASGVENVGATLVPFDQSDLVERRPYMHEGACYAFVLAWIRRQREIASNRPVTGKTQTVEDVSWLSEQKNRGNISESSDLFLRGNGLRSDGAIGFRDVDWHKLWFFLSARPGYYIVGVAPAIGSGHAIGFDTTNGSAIMFEPNYGAVTFNSAQDMKRFFGQFWGKAYPDLARGVKATIQRYV